MDNEEAAIGPKSLRAIRLISAIRGFFSASRNLRAAMYEIERLAGLASPAIYPGWPQL